MAGAWAGTMAHTDTAPYLPVAPCAVTHTGGSRAMIVMSMEVILSIVLGIIFLASAVPKLRHPKGFVLAVLEYRVLPPRLSWFYARLVPSLELLLALLLLTGTAVRSAAAITSVLLFSLIAAFCINLIRG